MTTPGKLPPFPLFSMLYGMIKGAYNYKVKRVRLNFKHLPPAFDNFKIVHISDIHLGSFQSNEPLQQAIELINKQQADAVFFTGDLVNYDSEETSSFMKDLSRIHAKAGVYSILGNHDYGNYKNWKSQKDWQNNLDKMVSVQKELGWHLLRNTNTRIWQNGDSLALIGVDNWSSLKRFKNYGNLEEAYEGVENQAFKILLSHDPTHWNQVVIQDYPQIDLTLSGHTHGMQFGFDFENFARFRMSPAKMLYKHWAGLYHKGDQYLYVNRGLGFFGFPARIGVYPEITVLELGKI